MLRRRASPDAEGEEGGTGYDPAATRGGLSRPDLVAYALKLRGVMLRDTNVVVMTVVAQNLIRIMSSLVLTRLLAPADFGVVGFLLVVQYTLIMITDLGVDAFVVRHKDSDNARFLDTVWTIRLIRAVALTIILAAVAGLIAHAMGKPEFTTALAVSALSFTIEGLGSLSLYMAIRRRQIFKLGVIDIIVALAQVGVGIALAMWLRSYWAIVYASLVSHSLKAVLSYVAFPGQARKFRYNAEVGREMWLFSRFVVGSSMITLAMNQLDKLVLSNVLSLDRFGLYMLAANLASAPRTFTEGYGARVLFPAFAAAFREAPESLPQVFHAKRRLVAPLYTFGVGGIIGSAPLIIAILYDDRYADSALFLSLLSLPVFFAMSTIAATEALVAIGQVKATFQANIVRLGWLVLAVSVALAVGRPAAIVYALALGEIPAMIFTWWRLRHAGVLSLRRELPTFLAGLAGIGLGIAVWQIAALLFPIKPPTLFW